MIASNAYGSVSNNAYQLVVNPANVDIGLYPGISISGTVGYIYAVQSSTNLSDTNAWLTETNITLTAPYQKWSDYNATTQPRKFYRVIAGQ